MPIAEMAGSASITNTEYSLPNNSTTLTAQTDDAVVQLFVDAVANLVAGDEFKLLVKEKVNAGTQRTVYESRIIGLQTGIITYPSFVLIDGWDITLTRISANSRTIAWSIRKIS